MSHVSDYIADHYDEIIEGLWSSEDDGFNEVVEHVLNKYPELLYAIVEKAEQDKDIAPKLSKAIEDEAIQRIYDLPERDYEPDDN